MAMAETTEPVPELEAAAAAAKATKRAEIEANLAALKLEKTKNEEQKTMCVIGHRPFHGFM